jgi:hypothetical protein
MNDWKLVNFIFAECSNTKLYFTNCSHFLIKCASMYRDLKLFGKEMERCESGCFVQPCKISNGVPRPWLVGKLFQTNSKKNQKIKTQVHTQNKWKIFFRRMIPSLIQGTFSNREHSILTIQVKSFDDNGCNGRDKVKREVILKVFILNVPPSRLQEFCCD